MTQVRKLWSFVRDTASEWQNDDVLHQSAAVAYFTIFSLPAFLLVILTVASVFMERSAIEQEFLRQADGILGPNSAGMLRNTVDAMQQARAGGTATFIGVVFLLLGASGVFRELQKTLNMILRVKDKPSKIGLLPILQKYLLSFSLLLSAGFLLLISLLLTTLIATFSRFTSSIVSLPLPLFYLFDVVVNLAVVFLLFATLYRYLPEQRFPWRSITGGAATATVLFLVGKFALSIYIAKAQVGSQFGVAAAVIVLLLWIYVSCAIFLTGAEVIDQLNKRRKSGYGIK